MTRKWWRMWGRLVVNQTTNKDLFLYSSFKENKRSQSFLPPIAANMNMYRSSASTKGPIINLLKPAYMDILLIVCVYYQGRWRPCRESPAPYLSARDTPVRYGAHLDFKYTRVCLNTSFLTHTVWWGVPSLLKVLSQWGGHVEGNYPEAEPACLHTYTLYGDKDIWRLPFGLN